MTTEEVFEMLYHYRGYNYKKGDIVLGWDKLLFRPFVIDEYDYEKNEIESFFYGIDNKKLTFILHNYVPFNNRTRCLLDYRFPEEDMDKYKTGFKGWMKNRVSKNNNEETK